MAQQLGGVMAMADGHAAVRRDDRYGTQSRAERKHAWHSLRPINRNRYPMSARLSIAMARRRIAADATHRSLIDEVLERKK